MLAITEVAESTYYYKPTTGTRGRTATTTTLDVEGRVWTEEELVALIAAELEREFVDYGYIKITKWLQRKHKLLINRKKVYRLMAITGCSTADLSATPPESNGSGNWYRTRRYR